MNTLIKAKIIQFRNGAIYNLDDFELDMEKVSRWGESDILIINSSSLSLLTEHLIKLGFRDIPIESPIIIECKNYILRLSKYDGYFIEVKVNK